MRREERREEGERKREKIPTVGVELTFGLPSSSAALPHRRTDLGLAEDWISPSRTAPSGLSCVTGSHCKGGSKL